MSGGIYQRLHDSFVRSIVTCVLWDFDGTLYDSPALGDAIYAAYVSLYRTYVGDSRAKEEGFRLLSEKEGSWSRALVSVSGKSEGYILSAIDDTLDYASYVKPDPYIVRLLQSLNRYRHFIISNASYRQISRTLPHIGLDSRQFEFIAGREVLGVLKPDPGAFSKARELTGQPAWRHLFIGDSYEMDVKPALRSGFFALHRSDLSRFFGTI